MTKCIHDRMVRRQCPIAAARFTKILGWLDPKESRRNPEGVPQNPKRILQVPIRITERAKKSFG